jgi:Calcineurin-like phosphoesterase
MPEPDRLLSTLRRAAQACRDTPGRRGRVVTLDGAADVLVAGDLHGNLENFRQLLHRADLAKNPHRHLVLQELIHGPHRYPEGGDKSHQLVDLVAALKVQYPRQVHYLLGNHELAQWTDRPIGKEDVDLAEQFWLGTYAAYGDRAEEVYLTYLELFGVVPLAVRTVNRVFLSHSLPSAGRLGTFDPAVLERDEADPGDLLPGGSVYSLVWGRDVSAANVAEFVRRVDADLLVTGHIPCDEGFAVPNDRQLILDSLGSPACCCLFPADRPLTHQDLVGCAATL